LVKWYYYTSFTGVNKKIQFLPAASGGHRDHRGFLKLYILYAKFSEDFGCEKCLTKPLTAFQSSLYEIKDFSIGGKKELREFFL